MTMNLQFSHKNFVAAIACAAALAGCDSIKSTDESPSIARPIARAVPTSRGSQYVPPESGTRPILQNGSMKL